ncbi:MAG: hypothetical protein PSU94_18275 [Lacunisphaera sp.]|nr:hypothetical protein [Lacunisphaera sp.]
MRRLVLFLTAFALAVMFAVVPTPDRASAVTVPPVAPGIPTPVNILPSVVKGAINGPTGATNIAVLMATFAKDARFWNYVKTINAGGTLTEAQSIAYLAQKANFKVPAIAGGGLIKLANGVGVAQVGLQVGLWAGNGVATALGFDANSICVQDAPGGPLRAIGGVLNGADCSSYDMTQEAIQTANNDAIAGMVATRICLPDGSACMQYVGLGSNWGSNFTQCFDFAGEGDATVRFYRDGVQVEQGSIATWKFYGQTFNGGQGVGHCSAFPLGTALGVRYTDNAALSGYSITPSGGSPVMGTVGTAVADPDRFLKCTLHTTVGDVAGFSASFKESASEYPAIQCPELPSGGVLQGWTITLVGGPDELVLREENVTPEYGDWGTTYPECGEGTCMLDLQKAGLSCFSDPVPCADWFADPDKEATYQCRYGDNPVALSECSLYGPSFKPSATTTGQEYGDPTTGEAVTTTQPKDSATFGDGVLDPEGQRACFPTGWAVLNPVEWVTKPVQCALQWAFVPRTSVVQAKLSDLDKAWSSTLPYRLIATVTAWDFIPPPSGCNGITVSVWFLGPPFQIMEACPGDMLEPLAYWSRIFGNISFAVYGVIALTRHVARIFAFGGIGE